MNVVPLFHPNKQDWNKHFTWIQNGLRIEGVTAIGRATVAALQLNRDVLIEARTLWIGFRVHPPS